MPAESSDAAPDVAPASEAEGGSPWVLRLGNYLQKRVNGELEAGDGTPWAVRLGTYLQENKPGPWSLVANERPQDPLALRLGTFLNETQPIGLLHPTPPDADGLRSSGAEAAGDEKPLVLRLGQYLLGEGEGEAGGGLCTSASSPTCVASR